MSGNEAVRALTATLETAGVAYMVTGSYATNVYGIPRSTKDADFIVEAPHSQIDQVLASLPRGLQADDQMMFETVTASQRWIVRVEGSSFVAELFVLNRHPFDRSRFDRRVRIEFLPGLVAWLPTPEDVVVQKLRWCARTKREKDFDDARNVIAVQADQLDWPYIERWCGEFGVTVVLTEAREAAKLD